MLGWSFLMPLGIGVYLQGVLAVPFLACPSLSEGSVPEAGPGICMKGFSSRLQSSCNFHDPTLWDQRGPLALHEAPAHLSYQVI